MSLAGPISFEIAADLLGGHVAERAHDLARPGQALLLGILAAGQAEVDDHRLAPRTGRLDHDVGGLQVAVDDLLLVRLLQGQGELAHQRRDLALRPALVADQGRQRLALDVGHRQVKLAIDFPGVIHGAEVGVVERGRGAGLFQEPSSRLGTFVISEVGHLQGHRALEWVSWAR